MKNAYPELPVLPFQQTSVGMPDVIAYLKSMPAPAGVDPALFAAMKRKKPATP